MNNSRKLLPVLVLATTLLTSCGGGGSNDEDDDFDSLTLREVMLNNINNRTTDTAEPIQINDLEIDTSSEDETQFDDILQ